MDNIFGIHAEALKIRASRAELLAANIANADTPNFKARDIDFKNVLSEFANSGSSVGNHAIERTHTAHLDSQSIGNMNAEVLYRSSIQPSLDGNTVDLHAERSAFMENALQYQASLRFLNGRISGIQMAIRGEI